MKVIIVEYPGSYTTPYLADVLTKVFNYEVETVWHKEEKLSEADLVILPGGASFANYLRPGALARLSPISAGIRKRAAEGGLILGIANGFQILCELGLLPGVLLVNDHLQTFNNDVHLFYEEETPCPLLKNLKEEEIIRLPAFGTHLRYYADKRTLNAMNENQQIPLRFSDEFGEVGEGEVRVVGSVQNVAAVANRKQNVLGIIAHPERALGILNDNQDGKKLLSL